MTYSEENNQVASFILETFQHYWTKPFIEQEKLNSNIGNDKPSALEFFITPNCNQACNYCYLFKHKNELYPLEIRDNQQILNNLKIFLEYCLEKKYLYLPYVDLFSGEIWGYPFGNQIFDTILEYLKKGLHIKILCIPSNLSFCNSKKLINIIQDYIWKFKDYNCSLVFSVSYDGIVIDNLSRPSIDSSIFNKENDEYIDNMFSFAQKNNFAFHPMISQFGIEHQIENYTEWIKMIKKYWGEQEFKSRYGLIMQLETREAGWTDEKIIHYLKWLKFLIDTDMKEYFDNDIKNFYENCLKAAYTGEASFPPTYMPYQIQTMGVDRASCDFGNNLQIRLGDLALVPCHRTSYKQFILGRYKVENNKIIGFQSENLPLMNSMYMTGLTHKPFCSDCSLGHNCTKCCFGANFEANKELFYPEPSNCNLQKAKVIFLINYYRKLKIIDGLPYLLTNENNLLQKEPEVYKKWTTIAQQII